MSKRKTIFLTIDDAPSTDFREKINFLVSNSIPAIIFCIGKELEKYPEAIIDAIHHGFIIGNHSYSHPKFSSIPFLKAKQEIYKTDQLIESLYSKAKKKRTIKVFRFPYGDKGWRKKLNFKLKNVLPSRINNKMNALWGNHHKGKIQHYLKELGYFHPTFSNVTYSYYHELNLMNENDLYWTFDFCEYKIKSIDKIFTLMQSKENWDTIHSQNYKIGSLVNNTSDDIVLIHDHAETSHLFYRIIERCKQSNIRFKTL